MNIGEQLIYWRKLHSYTQIQIAEKIGVTERMYRRYELSEVSPPIHIMIKLADIYKLPLDKLVGRNFRYE